MSDKPITIDDYPTAKVFDRCKCPNCLEWVENLSSYLDSIEDKASTRITCPHCEARIEVRCLVTIDCSLAYENESWGIFAHKSEL
jgi:hypothetical protein